MNNPVGTEKTAARASAQADLRAVWDETLAELGRARNAIDNPRLYPPPPSDRNLAKGYRYLLGFVYGLDEVASETTSLGGVPTYPAVPPGAGGDRAYLDNHGGGLIMGGGELCRTMGIMMAQRTGLPTYSVDQARVDVELHSFEGMPRGGFFGAPEDQELGAEVRRFVAACFRR